MAMDIIMNLEILIKTIIIILGMLLFALGFTHSIDFDKYKQEKHQRIYECLDKTDNDLEWCLENFNK